MSGSRDRFVRGCDIISIFLSALMRSARALADALSLRFKQSRMDFSVFFCSRWMSARATDGVRIFRCVVEIACDIHGIQPVQRHKSTMTPAPATCLSIARVSFLSSDCHLRTASSGFSRLNMSSRPIGGGLSGLALVASCCVHLAKTRL